MNLKQGTGRVDPGEAPEAGENSGSIRPKTKFTGYGREMIQKKVKQSGNSGRVYLPPEWVGKVVKVIRVD